MIRTARLREVRAASQPLAALDDLDALMKAIGAARIVLIGEATHGRAEFYRLRALLTRRLIGERRFDAVAVEADWPAAMRASRWAQGDERDAGAIDALGGFERFPRWRWRNTEVAGWPAWLRAHNATLPRTERIGFYGLDLYSLRESIDALLRYLDATDPAAAARARARYACFDDFADDPQAYGHAVEFGLRPDCAQSVVAQLVELCRDTGARLAAESSSAADERFYAQQNGRVVREAERYYRASFDGRTDSWNVRDRHMGETLRLLDPHLNERRGRPARIVVWAHNSHLGDARATEAATHGRINLGQLVREGWPAADTFLLGFTTHAGTVTAADDWDLRSRTMPVVPSRDDSVERLLHDASGGRHVLVLRDAPPALREALSTPMLERAIGVVYRPDTERWSHYFHARLADQFDAVVHLDTTTALRPLDAASGPEPAEAEAETYPSGL
ncbi:MAG TPA: erythromycin esterase family protein [Caldimonas sp.]|nr:erythromycin esterase family protein [Caldimonas sp.]